VHRHAEAVVGEAGIVARRYPELGEAAEDSTIISNMMTMYGGLTGKPIGGLPPTKSDHVSDVHCVSSQAAIRPTIPPSSVKTRTRLTGRSRSRTSSISWTGSGVYTVRS
jgi:hypothetical protein